MLSLREMGMPWRGPRSRCPLRPRGRKSSDSAFLACVRASSAVTVIYAFSVGLGRSMRSSISLTSSTGESLRLRKSFPTSSMDAKASSASFMRATLNHNRRYPDWISWEDTRPSLKNLLLAAQIPESADVRDDECDAELILRAHLPEIDAPILDGEPAAASVVTHLNDLVLQRLVFEIVAESGDEIKAPA